VNNPCTALKSSYLGLHKVKVQAKQHHKVGPVSTVCQCGKRYIFIIKKNLCDDELKSANKLDEIYTE